MKCPRSIPALVLAALTGCATPAPLPPSLSGELPALNTTPPPPRRREEPPPSAPAKPLRFPAAVWSDLPSGLRVAVVPGKALPLVHVRVVIAAGTAADGERPGLAAITAQLVASGGA